MFNDFATSPIVRNAVVLSRETLIRERAVFSPEYSAVAAAALSVMGSVNI